MTVTSGASTAQLRAVRGPDRSDSQADSAGSIPVTRSNIKIQASGIFRRRLLVNSLFEWAICAISVQLATGADAPGVALAAVGATCLL